MGPPGGLELGASCCSLMWCGFLLGSVCLLSVLEGEAGPSSASVMIVASLRSRASRAPFLLAAALWCLRAGRRDVFGPVLGGG